MVTWAAWAVAGVWGWAGPQWKRGPEGPDAVQSALARGSYPWYDAKADSYRPVVKIPPAWLDRFFEWLGGLFRWLGGARIPWVGRVGDLIAIGLVMLALAVLIVVLIELWRRYRPVGEPGAATVRAGSASWVEGLPVGVRGDAGDPWDEAVRLRARGDLAGAVVYLFAHQLLTLEGLRQIRLVPGRTGRQYVRAIGDPQFRAGIEPTLALFEAVYYGHRTPTAEAFEAAWRLALAFRERAIGARTVS
jgi:hypothetical protein